MRFGRNSNENTPFDYDDPKYLLSFVLEYNEEIIWVDSPSALLTHAKPFFPLILIGIPFLAIAVLNWQFEAYELPQRLILTVFSIVGAGMMLSPLWYIFKARKLIYALTDKNLVIYHRFPHSNVETWPLTEVTRLFVVSNTGDYGDVIFGRKEIGKSGGNTYLKSIGFIGISKPYQVEQLIRNHLSSE